MPALELENNIKVLVEEKSRSSHMDSIAENVNMIQEMKQNVFTTQCTSKHLLDIIQFCLFELKEECETLDDKSFDIVLDCINARESIAKATNQLRKVKPSDDDWCAQSSTLMIASLLIEAELMTAYFDMVNAIQPVCIRMFVKNDKHNKVVSFLCEEELFKANTDTLHELLASQYSDINTRIDKYSK